mgnify:CR=1 FL=1
MNRPRFSFLFFFSISLLVAGTTLAQTDTRAQPDSNYEAILQVILGSSEAGQGGGLPKNLAGITNQLKDNFTFSNYKLVNTYLGRIANSGNLEYKSMANIYGQEQEGDSPSFLDWKLGNFRRVSEAPGRGIFQVQSFRFGARVPLRVGGFKDESGKAQPVINYESLGLSLDKLILTENSPALIGTLSLPKTTGTVFLVLTVKSLEN